ncbi:MFS transporter, partial [Kitasatospora phosalacinea]|uniref:MFS transporter n=1 Tax=Kitasatospora phosalacinea TaxID=2065 RepID=UPI0036681CF7
MARAHRATLATFALNGLLMASWLARIPSVKESAGLSAGALGTVLTAPVVATLLVMQLATPLTARYGSRALIGWCLPGTAAALVAASLAPGPAGLVAALGLFGIADGLLYVAMHTHGVRVEALSGRTRMNAYHAAWSGGALLGAAAGAALAWAGCPLTPHFLLVGGLTAALAAGTAGGLLPAEPRPAAATAPAAPAATADGG